MTFASVSAVTVTLLILGVFLLVAMNVQYLAEQVEDQVEIKVTLDILADDNAIASVEQQLKAIPGVEKVTFVSKEEGLKMLRKSFKDKAYLLDGLEDENPLPDSFLVKAKTPQETGAIAGRIQNLKYVDTVNYGKETVEKLFSWTKMLRNVGVVFIIGLAFTAMFLIANTIKLTIVARRKEIEIMRLVGATNWFIRWPFFVEGLTMGVLGALIPIILLTVGYYWLLDFISDTPVLQLLPIFPLAWQVAVILICIGAFIGIWGSLVSVRRFLQI
jgi:cell division transport system permease protein